MFHPSLHDDGMTVTLDLHGATVSEALDLARRVVAEAARRGRSNVKLIHGASSSEGRGDRQTIKGALQDRLDRGMLDASVKSTWYADGHAVVSLDVTARSDSRRIRLLDLLP